MDKRLEQKINEKIQESLDNIKEVRDIANSLKVSDVSFKYGLVIGRLYNSFYYQTRRILNRDPTKDEFLEFLKMLNNIKSEILKKLS